LVTTLPAPIVHPSPIVTPARTMTLPPIQQSSPIVIGAPNSGPSIPARSSGSTGCEAVKIETLGPNNTRAPIFTWHVSNTVKLKLMYVPAPTVKWIP
ncbi:hypothetical protein CC80DRAFT_428038, partial [Byssothecium circinans]